MFAWPQGGSATPAIGPDGRVYTKLGELALGIHEPAGSAVEIGAKPGLIPYMSSPGRSAPSNIGLADPSKELLTASDWGDIVLVY